MDLNLNDMTMTKALLKIEKMNHDAVDSLVKKGYTKAESLHCTLKRNAQSCESEHQELTVPGTTEHQR